MPCPQDYTNTSQFIVSINISMLSTLENEIFCDIAVVCVNNMHISILHTL